MFIIAFIIIAIACSVISVKTLVGYSDINIASKLFIAALVIIGWFAPLLISCAQHFNFLPPNLFNILSFTGYTLFGFGFIIFCLLMLRDIIWYGIYYSARLAGIDSWSLNPKNISVLGYANILVVLLGLSLGGYALYEGVRIPDVNYITVTSPLLNKSLRLVQLSDTHINRTTPLTRVRKIVDLVNNLSPDVILLTGDIVDDDSTVINEQLAVLSNLSAPYGVYAVIGNHEFMYGVYAWMYQYKKLGFNVLLNQGETVANNIFISGIPDAFTSISSPNLNINLTKSLEGSHPKQFRVLLSHTPEVVNSISSFNYQLMLAGHTHGGQIFPFHLFVKKANQYLSGDYEVNGIKLHVSPGAGTWGPSMRLLAPSEIAVIDLVKK